MNKIAQYFDERADDWDASGNCEHNRVQGAVLSLACVQEGDRVLDLGCGTGVMMPVYLEAKVASATGVDLSSRMVACAREKFQEIDAVDFIAADVLDLDESHPYDAVVIYNAYPHFMDKPALVEKVYRLLKPGKRFVVAHGTGKDGINQHHQAVDAGVSSGLRAACVESEVWRKRFDIEALVDTPAFYAFSGVRR
uniref:class I SAM-dependent methyltransferase n=1 Tax=Vaginimicrobium propionicum TaxID=1871034 RepID=UPI00097034A3|nr:class I SAM-dependent methyltransferase [Vaginimicrobium propionicum]